jgi:hypothetical protein
MHLFMVQVEVQVDVWYMSAQFIGTGCYRLLVQVDWYRFTIVYLIVIV